MKIVRAEIAEFRIPFVSPLETAKGMVTARDGLLVRLVSDDETWGVGEGSPASWVGGESFEEVRAALRRVADRVASRLEVGELRGILERRESSGALPAAAVCALDTALLDLVARSRGEPVATVLGARETGALPVSALIGGASSEALAESAGSAAAEGYRCVKIKIGRRPVEVDRARIRAVRARVGPGVAIRLDANRAWGLEDAKRALDGLASLGVELVEEPLRSADPNALAALRASVGVAIALDESIAGPEDLSRALAARAADVVVVKSARLGGPTAALELAREALASGVGVVVTDSIETSVGMSAAIHLAAALPSPHRPLGLGGARLLGRDPVRTGRVVLSPEVFPAGPGLGVVSAQTEEGIVWGA